ncbi:hypothetical protein [Herminiimonas fonticola]|uniref:Uncharacterized protein n=1 Tax=Herminiimonas fonticola TaxID=303380 RepID=A0A4R6GKB9_9BURK|nr:hypothetical protein [Herminiimonas fonticola]RBA25665.1 hypothetical protein Hfont_1298 [Herminiimonas fonticola]TDN94774.1 hypothetical protein EV677_1330 [Herminiimonas fonticola]
MSKLEHPVAVYYDKHGKRHEILASTLSNPAKFAESRNNDLLDESEQISLGVREESTAAVAHFFEKAESRGSRKISFCESDPRHNERVDKLVSALQRTTELTLEICFRKTVNGEKTETTENIANLSGYRWGPEVHRIQDAKTIIRHDIFAQDPELAMSIHRPWIAIEVINTHFPDEQTFNAMLKTSEALPLMVLFDFVERKDYFLKVDEAKKTLRIQGTTYYIKEGKLWRGENATKIASSREFETEYKAMIKRWTEYRKNNPLA